MGDADIMVAEDVRYVQFDDLAAAVDDILIGSWTDDELRGDQGADIIDGKKGDDLLSGERNDDVLFGGDGNDSLYGNDGEDQLLGQAGNDSLDGGDQNDHLDGGDGYDTLKGGSGDDVMAGGLGDDELYGHSWGNGGDGTDTAIFDGNYSDYAFELQVFWNSSRGEDVERLIVTDAANGGTDGFYEGRDMLMDIEILQFADQTVMVDSLDFV